MARQPGPCRELRKCSLFGDVQGDRRLGCFASPRVELCHLLCFVCGRGSASTRPPPQQVSTRCFQAAESPARSQPEANQTFFLIARSHRQERADLAGQPGPCRELRKCSLFRKLTRGIVPSTLLCLWEGPEANQTSFFDSQKPALWEGQCLHQAAGRSSQFQPGKYEIFPGRGMSNQKASQKPARSQPGQPNQPKQAREG